MEKVKGLDQRAEMINEIVQGMELAKQLRDQILLISPTNPSSSNYEALNHSLLLDKMLSSIDKTMSMAKLIDFDKVSHQEQPSHATHHSLAITSPASQNSHKPLHVSKKRKTMPRWIERVQVSPEGTISGLEGPLDDGFSWRKYGQKHILGSNFPRGYYRCTHRYSEGCVATKHVQRSDEDSSIYQVIYRGDHTCTQGTHMSQAQVEPNSAQIKPEPQSHSPITTPEQNYQITQPAQQEVFLGFGPEGDLRVEPELCDNKAHNFRSLSFKWALLENEPIDNYIISCSPCFGGSPATSESNHIPVSPYRTAPNGVGLNVQTSESDHNEAFSGPNSVTNSPIIEDFEFSLDQLLDIDANFPFQF